MEFPLAFLFCTREKFADRSVVEVLRKPSATRVVFVFGSLRFTDLMQCSYGGGVQSRQWRGPCRQCRCWAEEGPQRNDNDDHGNDTERTAQSRFAFSCAAYKSGRGFCYVTLAQSALRVRRIQTSINFKHRFKCCCVRECLLSITFGHRF